MNTQTQPTQQLKEIQNICSKLDKSILKLKDKENQIVTNSNGKIDNEEFLNLLNTISFNLSFSFDNISYDKTFDCYFINNLYYAEINKTILTHEEITKHFPSFYKIKNEISNLKKEKEHLIAINPPKNNFAFDTLYDNDESYLKSFSSIEEFKDYLKKYENISSLYSNLLKEIETYIKNENLFIISDSGIKICYHNGGRSQEILFKNNNNLFKISILSQFIEKQSYGVLYKDTNKAGWMELKRINPKRDYQINLTNKYDFKENAFEKIIKDFFDIAKKI
jgi:hypothetical protein